MCGAGPGDLGGSRGSASAENPEKTGLKISSITAFRYPDGGTKGMHPDGGASRSSAKHERQDGRGAKMAQRSKISFYEIFMKNSSSGQGFARISVG